MLQPARARPHRAAVVALGWLALAVAASFLPWAASGRAERSSFALFRVADRLDLLPAGRLTTLARGWPLLPLAAAVALAALALGRPRLAAALAAALGVATAAASVTVVRSPLAPRPGVWLAMAAGAGTVLVGLWAALRPAPTGAVADPAGPASRPSVAPGTVPVAPPAPR